MPWHTPLGDARCLQQTPLILAPSLPTVRYTPAHGGTTLLLGCSLLQQWLFPSRFHQETFILASSNQEEATTIWVFVLSSFDAVLLVRELFHLIFSLSC